MPTAATHLLPEYITKAELAAHLGCHERTITRLQTRKRDPLPMKKLGRRSFIEAAEFERWLERQQPAALRARRGKAKTRRATKRK